MIKQNCPKELITTYDREINEVDIINYDSLKYNNTISFEKQLLLENCGTDVNCSNTRRIIYKIYDNQGRVIAKYKIKTFVATWEKIE